MTGDAQADGGRPLALARLADALDALADLGEQFTAADSDRERRSVLLSMVSAAWQARDRATEAYEALVRAGEADGIARGVVE